MLVYFVLENNKEVCQEMPCFGNTGRVDWKGVNMKLYDDICKRSGQLGICVPTKKDSAQDLWRGENKVTHIRLKSDDLFRHLFHVSFFPVLEYIVHRSIWAPLFDKTAKEIMDQNYIDMRVDVLPSEIQTSLHVFMRDVFRVSTFSQSFQLLREQMPEHLAFGVSLGLPTLGLGDANNTMLGRECFYGQFSIDFWVAPDIQKLKVIPYTMREVHGYVMNLTRVWGSYEGKVTLSSLREYLQSKSKHYTVKGLFGDIPMRGVQDPAKVVLQFLENKKVSL